MNSNSFLDNLHEKDLKKIPILFKKLIAAETTGNRVIFTSTKEKKIIITKYRKSIIRL